MASVSPALCPNCGALAQLAPDDSLSCAACGLGTPGSPYGDPEPAHTQDPAPDAQPVWETVEPEPAPPDAPWSLVDEPPSWEENEAPPPDADVWEEPEDAVRGSETFSWMRGDAQTSYPTDPDATPATEPLQPIEPAPSPAKARWWHDPAARKKALVAGRAAGIAFLLLFSVWLVLDLDGDGLRAYREFGTGTNAFAIDTDDDGLTDGWEFSAGLAPDATDSDNDGLDDGDELALKSDPHIKDSDGDGVLDGTEADLDGDPTTTDSDGDGLSDAREVEAGTALDLRDTDADGLDDLHEVVYGSDPLVADTDGDGLPDGEEAHLGGDPFKADTDGDGIPDLEEARAPVLDCDNDGVPGIREWDDDDDGLKDILEETGHRCDRDVDRDGVPDGAEGNHQCVFVRDCDGDGLADGVEDATEFDPLKADTFDVGLMDSVSWIFKENGQNPSRDEDGDAIPDAWEGSRGLIDWGSFSPQPGRKDLLIEFVRVQGPDSGDYGFLSFHDAYALVQDTFQDDADINMQYTETRVWIDSEKRPPLIPSAEADYYVDVLARARHSGNPYVTTVVLNPQHDVSQIAHAGAAPIRGMLATVDYGQFVKLQFTDPGNATLTIRPYVESAIAGGRTDILNGFGFSTGGTLGSGEYYVQHPTYRLVWTPSWFSVPPRIEMTTGKVYDPQPDGGTVEHAQLASTMLHEIGHTLGLCHSHDTTCSSQFAQQDQERTHLSTMSYDSTDSTLYFLPSEWSTIHTYIRCPPEETIVALVEGADAATLIDRKYGYTLEEILSVDSRSCGTFLAIPLQYTHEPDQHVYAAAYLDEDVTAQAEQPRTYALPERWSEPDRDAGDIVPSLAYVAFTILAMAGAAGGPTVWRLYLRERFT